MHRRIKDAGRGALPNSPHLPTSLGRRLPDRSSRPIPDSELLKTGHAEDRLPKLGSQLVPVASECLEPRISRDVRRALRAPLRTKAVAKTIELIVNLGSRNVLCFKDLRFRGGIHIHRSSEPRVVGSSPSGCATAAPNGRADV